MRVSAHRCKLGALKEALLMVESFVGVILLLAVVTFWAVLLFVLWQMLHALQSIHRSLDEIAKTLHTQKS
jgi:hypothetical protein